MNTYRYRVIFNTARGCLVAVAETAKSHSKRGSKRGSKRAASTLGQLPLPTLLPRAAAITIEATLRPLAFALLLSAQVLCIPGAHADGIVADSSAPANQQPVILNAANGVPQVNIQTPSAAGVSRNTYSEFDVGTPGVILNNSRTDVQTQLGGYVQANPYLAAGTARVILNEVNSSNPSLLHGYVEVAGSRAQVVIANPAGISCNGCGFINANRTTLTTGTAILNNGNLEGYRVQRGIVSILGNGMGNSQTDYTDIIAHAVQVNADLYANDLRVTTGSNQVNVASDGSITSTTAISGTGTAPSVAIDVAQLGGMYAGKIYLIGTEAGVGVTNAGRIGASAGEVRVDVNGMLTNAASAQINSSQDAQINASAGISNAGSVYALGNTTLSTQGDITNSGTIAALGNVNLAANGAGSSISVSSDSIIAAGLDADGRLSGTSNLYISATNALVAKGQQRAQGNLSLNARSLDLSGSQTSANNLILNASQGNIDASGATIVAAGTLTASAYNNNDQVLITDRAKVAANQFSLQMSNFSNVEGELIQTGSGDTAIVANSLNNSRGFLNNTDGRIASNGLNLTLAADQLTNTRGSVEHAGMSMLSIQAGTLIGGDGQLLSNGYLNALVSGSTLLDGANTSANQITIRSDSLSNVAGRITQSGSNATRIETAQAIDNTLGAIASNGNLDMVAASINNTSGTLQAVGTGNVNINTTGNVTNAQGQISAAHDVMLTAATLVGNGKVMAGRDASVSLQGDYTNTASNQLSADQNLSLSVTGTLTNTGTLQAVDNLSLTANVIENQAILGAGQLLKADAAAIYNRGSIIGADVQLSASQRIINAGSSAFIGATNVGGQLVLLSPIIENRDDTTSTDSAASTMIYGMGAVTLAGGQTAMGDYTAAQYVLNQSGLIESGSNMLIKANRLTNTRRVLQMSSTFSPTGATTSGSAVWTPSNPDIPGGRYIEPPHGGRMNSDYIQNDYTGTTYTNSLLSISPKSQIIAGGNLAPETGLLQNYWSQIAANGNIPLDNISIDQDSWRGATAPISRTVYTGTYLYRTYRGEMWTNSWGPQTIDTPISGYDSSITAQGNITGSNVSINNVAAGSRYTPVGMPALASPLAINAETIASSIVVLPNNALFRQAPNSNANYLVETNPRFTEYRSWLSSDYLLSQLSYDPATTQKRLGDGFYEQKLVRDQVAQLTGRQFLTGYSSNEAQYQALMNNGVVFAQAYNLIPGVALSAAQMAALTSDIVWLIQKTVTLADGTTSQVLVPQVYLKPQSMVLTGTGSLIAANNIALTNIDSFTNSGTIVASNTLSLGTTDSSSINNRGGTLQSGGAMTLATAGSIDFTSASIQAGSLQLNAGQDLLLNTGASTITTAIGNSGTRTSTLMGSLGSITVTGDAQIATGGNLQQNGGLLKVGGNLTTDIQGDWTLGTALNRETTQVTRMGGHSNTDVMTHITSRVQVGGVSDLNVVNNLDAMGAEISLQGGGTINTGGNLTLRAFKDSVAVDASSSGGGSGRRYAESRNSLDEQVYGTQLTAGQNLALSSNQDITLKGSTIQLTQGTATLLAAGSLTLQTESEQHLLDSTHSSKKSGMLSSKASNEQHHLDTKIAMGSTVSADNVTLLAGYATDQSGQLRLPNPVNATNAGNISVLGSNVVSTNGTTLNATNNITIEAAQNTLEESHFNETKKSGLMSSGGIGFSIGKQQLRNTQTSQSVTHTASTIGSTEGDVTITAGKAYTQTGSDVLAPQGEISITAQSVDINAAQNTTTTTQQTKFKQTGITVSISNPVVSAVQTTQQMVQAASQTSDGRMQALAAATTALAAKNAYDAVQAGQAVKNGNAADKLGGINVSVSFGTSKSQSESTQTSSTAQDSSLSAGQDINITATGAGTASDINIVGSQVKAGDNVTIKADDQINLVAAQNTSTLASSNKSSSASIGGSVGSSGMAVTASLSKGKGSANGNDLSWTETIVQGGNQNGDTTTLQSGTDINLIGAQVIGNQVIADVGITGQGNLNIQSLQDTSTYNSQQKSAGVSVSVPIGAGTAGGSVSASKSKITSDYASVNEQAGILAGDGGFQVSVADNTNLVGSVMASTQTAIDNNLNSLTTQTLTVRDIQNNADYQANVMSATVGGGIQAGLPVLSGAGTGSDEGHASSVTVSAISAGTVTITNSESQQALTGQDAVTTIALLNRDVHVDENGNAVDSNGNSTAATIAPIFDAEKVSKEIQAQVQITQAFSEQAYQAVGTYVQKQRASLNTQLKNAEKPEDKAAIQAQLNELRTEEQVLNVLIGAVTGFGGTALTKEVLSAAAQEMRRITIESSRKSAGVVDKNGNTLTNLLDGKSEGVNGDGIGTGGTRVDLDLLCGTSNQRCATQKDANGNDILDQNGVPKLALNEQKQVVFNAKNPDDSPMSLEEFIKTPEGQKMVGATGGIQGYKGTFFGEPYEAGSWQDKLVESFGGTHDVIGGQLTGLYDEQGNIKRGMTETERSIYNNFVTTSAIIPSAPFAMSELLSPEVWSAIAALLEIAK